MGSRNHLNLTLRSVETEKALSVTSSPADMDGKPASPPNNKTSNSATSSPRTSRKRTNDEVYRPSQAAHSSPPRLSDGLKRPNTAPEQSIQRMPARQSMFATHGFSAFDSSNSATSTLKPESSRGSITTAVKKPNAFQVSIKEYQDNLDKECRLFERKLNERDGNAELEDIDWDELEGRCHAAMDPKITAEQDVMRECSALFQHFLIWTQMSSEREADRALKRLRTRMAYVQNSEEMLEDKKAHYLKVVNAFNSAMALLGNI